MSGGSFNYLYMKENPWDSEAYTEMMEWLARFPEGPGSAAAKDLFGELHRQRVEHYELRKSFERLEKVLQAVEWEVSADRTREDTIEALNTWARHLPRYKIGF